MTVEEIYQGLSERKLKGVMMHEYFTDYFNFLNLHGYKRMQEYHAKHEMKGFRKLHRYYIDHYNKLIPDVKFENEEYIPASWYQYNRQDVDVNTKKNAVKMAFEKWEKWEEETKKYYEKMYSELLDLDEIASAKKVCKMIKDVSCELKWVQRKHLDLYSADYSISYILGEQKYYHDFYKGKD